MQRLPLPMIGIPDAEDFVKAFLGALQKIFGGSAQEAIRSALNDLKDNVPVLDLASATFERYDGMFALSLSLGFIATALQLIRVVKLNTYESVFDAVKIIPIVYMFGAILPYATSVVAGMVGDFHVGIIEFVTQRSIDKDTFRFTLSGDFGFFSTIFGWIGGGLLNFESELMIQLLPQSLLVIVLVFGLRWFGFLGDGLFVIFVGIGFTMLVGSTVMVISLSLFFIGAQDSFSAGYIATAVFVSCLMPLLVFWIYFKFKFSQKVSGIMEMRQLNTAISVRTTGNAASGGLAGKVTAAGLGALGGSLYANSQGQGRDPNISRSDHMRTVLHDKMTMTAAVASRTNPLATAALLMGAKFVKASPKSDSSDN